MHKWISLFVILSLVLCVGAVVVAQDSSELEIKEMVDAWADYWNSGNIDAIGDLYAADADFVGVNGTASKGREAIVQTFKDLASTAYKDARIEIELTRVRFIKPDVAVGDGTWDFLELQPTQEQPPVTQGVTTFVVQKQDDQWVMLAHRSYVPTELPTK